MTPDDGVPHPQYRMCHSRVVDAPPTAVWDELCRGYHVGSARGICPGGHPAPACLPGLLAASISHWPDAPFS